MPKTKPKPKARKPARPAHAAPGRRPKTPHLPGLEPVVIPELDRLAEAYVETRNSRMKLTEQEVQEREALVATMRKHQQTVYRVEDGGDPLIVTLTETAKVQVRRAKDAAGGDEAGEA